MVSAVSASGSANVAAASTGSSRAALQAQVAEFKKQLADCQACPSYNTAKGKEDFQEVAGKLSSAQTRLAQVDANQALRSNPSVQAVPAQSAAEAITANALAPVSQIEAGAAVTRYAADAGRGSLIDTFA